jgi:acyl-CoA oxidase
MLMKLAYVDELGTFHRLGDPRLLYGAMLATRGNLCAFFAILLARATTIAIRYSAVRRQGQNPNGKETLILDYPLQQEKLVPSLATTYAFFYSFKKLENFRAQILENDTILFEQLPELHALSSGLKAYTSTIAERFSQICRVACGGHGFLVASGIKNLNNMLDAACSYEGDNAVLLQQTARYLLKAVQQIDENNEFNTESSIAYLYSTISPPKTIVNLDDYCRLFECRSQMLLKSISKQLIGSPLSTPYETFSKNSIELVHIAKAYVETFIVRAFYDGVRQASEHRPFTSVFEQLFHVFAIHTLRNQATDFIRLKLLTSDQIYQLETYSLPDMYTRLRPNLVTLVDTFDFHDNELDSCLGRYDGQAYEALLERARLNPGNRDKVHPVWKSIKENTKSKL